jgi:hypothetical protein
MNALQSISQNPFSKERLSGALRVSRYSTKEFLLCHSSPWNEILREISHQPAEYNIHEWQRLRQ